MEEQEQQKPQPAWRPLTADQRRVIGVLVEKAKTTPAAYPLTLNALTNGCNQKSNRDPHLNIASDDVELILDELRQMGAVTEVVGDGRVSKYRHNIYKWLDVEKAEIAVMAELLLRGQQTVGELRGRAARMEPIADLAALRPLLSSLIAKKLVISLTPEGRGQVVTHGLYNDRELAEIRSQVVASGASDVSGASPSRQPAASPAMATDSADALRDELAQLRAEVADLQTRLSEVEGKLA